MPYRSSPPWSWSGCHGAGSRSWPHVPAPAARNGSLVGRWWRAAAAALGAAGTPPQHPGRQASRYSPLRRGAQPAERVLVGAL